MLAELIQAGLAAHNWKSRDPLIRKSGLSQALVSKLVRGEIVNITTHTADRLATALDISAEEVFRAALADVRATNNEAAPGTPEAA